MIKKLIDKYLQIFNIKIVRYDKHFSALKIFKKYNFFYYLKYAKDKNIKKIFKFYEHSKSQIGQDILVLDQLNFKEKGFFVEFGACNGIDLSNTYILEKKFLWRGILCEPAKKFKKSLTRNRKCNIDFNCVYEVSNKKILFSESNGNEEYSTLSYLQNSNTHKNLRKNIKSYLVTSISINDLLKKYNCPKNFDYLSIDTEGSEYDIIKNLDFTKYRPKIITIEHNYQKNKREQIQKFLFNNNYKRVFEDISSYDDWYIKH
jgi:FkbM family methyltransferase